MAKRKAKSSSLLLTLVAILCGVLIIVGVIVPWMVTTTSAIGMEVGSTQIGGFDFMTALFSGDDALKSDSVAVVRAWSLMKNDTIGAATKTLAVSAFVGFVAAALGVISAVLKLVLKKSKLFTFGMKACFVLCLLFSIIGIICGFVIAGNSGLNIEPLGKLTNAVGVGVYLMLVGSLGAAAASAVNK